MIEPTLYIKANDLQRQGGREIAEEFADELAKVSGRCIDIGSGPGDVVAEFILPTLNPKATILCSDVSDRMVNYGKEAYKDNDRLSFIHLDIETRNLPNDLIGRFDNVTSFYCLQWCQDIRQAMENIFNLLRPGGTAILSLVSACCNFDAFEEMADIPTYQPYMKDRSRFRSAYHKVERPYEKFKKLLQETGYDIRHLSQRQMTHVFDTRKTLKDFLVSLNPFINRLPADLREEYEKDLLKTTASKDTVFQKYHKTNDYSTVLMYKVLVTHLEKPLSN